MVIPSIAPPVIRPAIVAIDQRLVQIGVRLDDDGLPIIDPDTGGPIPVFEWKLIKGADQDPNRPQAFCPESGCAGSVQLRCLAGERRRSR